MAKSVEMIRVGTDTKAGLMMVASELRASTGKAMTDDDVVWYLLEQAQPEIASRIKELSAQREANQKRNAVKNSET